MELKSLEEALFEANKAADKHFANDDELFKITYSKAFLFGFLQEQYRELYNQAVKLQNKLSSLENENEAAAERHYQRLMEHGDNDLRHRQSEFKKLK